MTVGQLQEILKRFPKNMEVMMPINKDQIRNVCPDNVQIAGIVGDGKVQQALLLNPCDCTPDIPELVQNLSQN